MRSADHGQSALCFAMVFSINNNPGGQEWRDMLRLKAMEEAGLDCWSYDDKHPETETRFTRVKHKLVSWPTDLPKHINGSFSTMRRLKANLERKFPEGKRFEFIIMDFFYCPIGWVKEAWTATFFKEVLPYLAQHWLCPSKGVILLPNNHDVQEMLHANRKFVGPMLTCSDCLKAQNPLYLAGEMVAEQLEREGVSNRTALTVLEQDFPFIALRIPGDFTAR